VIKAALHSAEEPVAVHLELDELLARSRIRFFDFPLEDRYVVLSVSREVELLEKGEVLRFRMTLGP
jgi:hypothetical protein